MEEHRLTPTATKCPYVYKSLILKPISPASHANSLVGECQETEDANCSVPPLLAFDRDGT